MSRQSNAKGVVLTFAFLTAFSPWLYAADHEAFTGVLHNYVRDGRVNYPELCRDNHFAGYLKGLSKTNPDSLSSRNAKLAFWINVYNAFTLKLICDHYPLKSISQLHTGGLIVGSLLGQTAWDRNII